MKRFLISFFCIGLLLAMLVSLSPSVRGIGFRWSALNGQDIMLKLAVSGLLVWGLAPRSRSFNPWHPTFLLGIVLGSVGLFFFRAFYASGNLRWGFQLLGSSIPELGSVLFKTHDLNPLFASALIPFGLMACFASQPSFKWLSFGIALGMTAFMGVAAFSSPTMAIFGRGFFTQIFLLSNAVVCGLCARLFMQADT